MNAAMKRARTSGELARQAGKAVTANPYRNDSSTRSPRRGSWSEAFSRQWALGWREKDLLLSQPVPAVPGDESKEVDAHPAPATTTPPAVPAKGIAAVHQPQGS